MARGITRHAEPPSACRKRSAMSTSMRGAAAQPAEASV
jgi:hypothetical protein